MTHRSFFSILVLVLVTVLGSASPLFAQQSFSWENATIYFALTDRFNNGDPSNDNSYGRGLDGAHAEYPAGPGHFLGGDFAGLLEKVNDNYFTDLGVNALWISAPYEQIHGFVAGENGAVQSYAYHGYWPLDFTSVDKNWGTENELKMLVDACHAKGIRVVLDVVMNHAGYSTVQDMDAFEFGSLKNDNWATWRPSTNENWDTFSGRFIDYSGPQEEWKNWWGSDWIRAGLPGYQPCGSDDQTKCLAYLPDFKTDSDKEVELPVFLLKKWEPEKEAQERSELEAFFDRTKLKKTPRAYLIKWLTDWIREYGIDGYRIDTAKHVGLQTWAAMKDEASQALLDWKKNNPHKSPGADDFWMMGEVFGYDATTSDYFANGFNALINFSFPGIAAGDVANLDSAYATYADNIASDGSYNIANFVSSHDVGLFDRTNLIDAGSRLLLAPGAAIIYYGDESARPVVGNDPRSEIASRSMMNWDSIDEDVTNHWKVVGQFRNRHPAIAIGSHTKMSDSPYVFSRHLRQQNFQDQVIVGMNVSERLRINVATVFKDDDYIRDAVSGATAIVSYGYVTITPHESGLVLLELVD